MAANFTSSRNDDYPAGTNPRDPLAFPPPSYESCIKITNTRVINLAGATADIRNTAVLVKTGHRRSFVLTQENENDSSCSSSSSSSSSNSSSNNTNDNNVIVGEERAYLIEDSIREAIYGEVWRGKVLTRANPEDTWRETNQRCAIKMMSLNQMQEGRNSGLAEDAEEECATMQFLCREHRQALHREGAEDLSIEGVMNATNTVMQLDALYDEQYFYNVLPYIDGGELFEVLGTFNNKFTEEETRFVIKQVLCGVQWLQRAGVSHRDMSLENLMIDKKGRVFIIDMGMCIRIPYAEEEMSVAAVGVEGIVINAREQGREDPEQGPGAFIGIDRRQRERSLITPQGQCGKFYCMSPEIYRNRGGFDGYAVDLWAVGIILFSMVTGCHPWEIPSSSDGVFRYVTGGRLVHYLNRWDVRMSSNAMDLLQGLLFLDPADRLSLNQVLAHPWMTAGPETNPLHRGR